MWGCAGVKAEEDQKQQQKWEQRQAEQLQKVSTVASWIFSVQTKFIWLTLCGKDKRLCGQKTSVCMRVVLTFLAPGQGQTRRKVDEST